MLLESQSPKCVCTCLVQTHRAVSGLLSAGSLPLCGWAVKNCVVNKAQVPAPELGCSVP